MSGDDLRWAPQPEPRKFYPILTVRLGSPLKVVAAGQAVGVYAHFWEGRSSPCSVSSDAGCHLCPIQQARWKGFLPAYRLTGQRVIVELTERLATNVPSLLKPSVRGWTYEFMRKGPNPNSPLLAVHLIEREQLAWPVDFDVRPSVLNMWGLRGDDLEEAGDRAAGQTKRPPPGAQSGEGLDTRERPC